MKVERVEPSRELIAAQKAFRQVTDQISKLQTRLHSQKAVVAKAKQALAGAEDLADRTMAKVVMGEMENGDLTLARKAAHEARLELSEAEDVLQGLFDANSLLFERRKEIEATVNREQRALCNTTVESRRLAVTESARQALEDLAALIRLTDDLVDFQQYCIHKGLLYDAGQAGAERANASIRELASAGDRM